MNNRMNNKLRDDINWLCKKLYFRFEKVPELVSKQPRKQIPENMQHGEYVIPCLHFLASDKQ